MIGVKLPLKWVPRRNPHPVFAAAVTVASLFAAWGVRVAVMGDTGETTSTMFPALMVIAIYAGWRWALGAWGVVILYAAAVLVSRVATGDAIAWMGTVLFLGSLLATIAVVAALRELVIRIDEESRARVAAEARFETLADSAPVLLWVTGPDRKRSFINRAYRDFLDPKMDLEKAKALEWRERLHPDDSDRLRAQEAAGELSKEPFTLEARFLRDDGEWRWLRSISRPRLNAKGEVDGYIGIATDITDAKRGEADLKRINELLAERVEEAMSERDHAQAAFMQSQKLEALGQLTGGVAHDFNNLLTVVIGALDLIRRNPDDHERRERMTEAALAAAKRGEKLTQQLLTFSRRQPLKPEVLDIDALLRQTEPLLQRATGESFTLAFDLGAPDCQAMLDAGQLEAAALNLVINARDASQQGGKILVSTTRVTLTERLDEAPPGDYCAITVSDYGQGMDADTAAHAFDPFFTTKPVGKGTGLGLSQVYGFVRQSGGGATIASAPGEGTTVRLLLPLAQAQAPAPEPLAPVVERRGVKVLLVEDEAEVAALVEAMLREIGHTAVRCADAAEALGVVRLHKDFDVVLTDVNMPGDKNGIELAQELTALRPGLPIILSSGYTGQTLQDAEQAPWPMLRKPYTVEALADTIGRAVEARQ